MAITKPYTFQAGTKARASEVNQDFDILYSEVNRIGTEILNIDIDIQNVAEGKADINGNAGQVFKMANPEDSYDGVNKNFLENSIANIKDYISGFVITRTDDKSITVSPGTCYNSTFTTILSTSGNITKDNNSQGANTTYYVHVIGDSAGYQTDILISSQALSPALPSGYTLYRLIGRYTTDSSSNISTVSFFGNNVEKDNSVYTAIHTIMPNFGNEVSRALNTTHTATDNGWLRARGSTVQGDVGLKINGEWVAYTQARGGGDTSGYACLVPISKGQTYHCIGNELYFIYCYGG